MGLIKKLNICDSIFSISPYQPGKSSVSGQVDVIKLSSNENSLGCSPLVKEKFSELTNQLNRYPDGDSTSLREKIASLHKIEKEQIICGAGSDEIINLIINAFTKYEDEIIHTEYGFLMYKLYALSNNVKPIIASEVNLTADINNILDKVTDKTRIVFIANPNNPTGSYLTYEQLKELRETLREDILLVIDGAYAEYVEEESYESGFKLVTEYNNVIATRTFSKIYGLASVRLGFGYMHRDLIDILNRIRSPFNVNLIAQILGEVAISDQEFIRKSREHNNSWIKKISDALGNLNIKFHPTVANFILLDLGSHQNAELFSSFLNQRGIIVRPTSAYNLSNKVRVTIGSNKENESLIKGIKDFVTHKGAVA